MLNQFVTLTRKMDSETVTKVAVCLIGSEQVKVWRFRSLDITLEEAEA